MFFAVPWILALLVTLPLLWWLLRVTPPAPKKVIFPALMLLRDIVPAGQTAARTPWWLLLLRLLIAALVIIAFADPRLQPTATGAVKGTLLLAIDNDWAAARAWPVRQRAAHDLIAAAAQENRQVILLPTTVNTQGDALHAIGPMAAAAALSELERLMPYPWPADWRTATQIVQTLDASAIGQAVWLSSGTGDIDAKLFDEALQRFKTLQVLADGETPIYTMAPQTGDSDTQTIARPALAVLRANTDAAAIVSVAALAANGEALAHLPATFTAGSPRAFVTLDLPLDVRNRIARFQIEGQSTAAATLLLDAAWQQRSVGLVGDKTELDQHSLLSGLFYLDRALHPFADLHIDTLDALLKEKVAVLIIPDAAGLSGDNRKAVQDWVKQGGILVRFAGDRFAAEAGETSAPRDDGDLLPVPLRTGGRALGGALSWETPQKLQAFTASSPFAGLEIPADVTVSRQILAEPSPDLAAHSWAALQDGTPLVTAKAVGQGLTILFHVPATADWSNLPLSGLFVDMLRRVVELSHGIGRTVDSGARPTDMSPLQALDAYGELQIPGSAARVLTDVDFGHTPVSPAHPPGLYGSAATSRAFNLGPALGQPVALTGIATEPYRVETLVKSFKPWLLLAAFILLLLDFGVSLRLRGLLARSARIAAALAWLMIFALPVQAAASNPTSADAVELTSKTYLAYVETGDRELDNIAAQGLAGLARILQTRTSMDRIGVIGVNPDTDELALFPLLYWPLAIDEQPVSPQAAQRINDYLHHGGMILFDTMTGEPLPSLVLQRLTAGLDIPPLVRLPDHHVLKRSFYLLDQLPGRYDNNDFWIEGDEGAAHDGVATVLEGNNGWAAAWAMDDGGRPLFPCSPGGEVQRERAYRFGVNLVMYALTGNYKSDQLHAQALLDKLGK